MTKKILSGTLLDEQVHLSLTEFCQACSSRTEWVIELVEEGILEPSGEESSRWSFPGNSLSKAQRARRLQHDLEINLAGVALVLELLDEIEALRSRLLQKEHLNE
jgi:chaperone modulatory protein CbpM